MNCNQPFSENRFTNGQFYDNNYYNIPQTSAGSSPVIVGEGEVTSITLPDGTCQYFFTPTFKWWTNPTAINSPPYYVHTMNTNNNNSYNNTNVGVWFIRSIDSPYPAYTTHSYPRYELPRPSLTSDCNLNRFQPGYQLKFHNDSWTSTTDIHYFYPCLRQYDCTFSFPARGCAAVQVDTPLTNARHYEVVCSKPCQCRRHDLPKTPSAMSLVGTVQSNVNCEYPKSQPFNDIRRQLLPTDIRNKRIKIEKSLQKCKSNDVLCQCSKQFCDKSAVTFTDSGCGSGPKVHVGNQVRQREWKTQKLKTKSKDVDCECRPSKSPENCIIFTDQSDVAGNDKAERDKCCERTSNVITAQALINNTNQSEAEIWCPKSNSSKKIFELVQKDTGT